VELPYILNTIQEKFVVQLVNGEQDSLYIVTRRIQLVLQKGDWISPLFCNRIISVIIFFAINKNFTSHFFNQTKHGDSAGGSNSISTYCFDNGDDKRGEASIAIPGVRSFGW